MSVDLTRPGNALTKQFTPVEYESEWSVRRCEDLAQEFHDLYANTRCDAELLGLFQKADEALSTLITEVYKRAEPDPLAVVLGAARTAVKEPSEDHLAALRTALEDY